MNTIKILITDDSVVYRTQIKTALAGLPWVEVIASASNGKIAISRLEQTQVDLVILDLEMPEMDGIETLKAIKSKNIKCKVLVFSSASKKGAEITLEALRLGAQDFIAKPGPIIEMNSEVANGHRQPHQLIREMLEPKLKGIFPEFQEFLKAKTNEISAGLKNYNKINWKLFRPKIVVLASSTGGPTVLEKIFSNLRPPLNCPILIVQHMPPIFTTTLAERLERLSGIPVREGIHGEFIESNRVYIAPGNFHMSLKGTADRCCIVLDQSALKNSVRPAADPLFESAASIFKDRCLGIVLTGMGSDGQNGSEKIKESGGAVIIQDQDSCVVFGMPGSVKNAGAYDSILSPPEIVTFIQEEIAPTHKLKIVTVGG